MGGPGVYRATQQMSSKEGGRWLRGLIKGRGGGQKIEKMPYVMYGRLFMNRQIHYHTRCFLVKLQLQVPNLQFYGLNSIF